MQQRPRLNSGAAVAYPANSIAICSCRSGLWPNCRRPLRSSAADPADWSRVRDSGPWRSRYCGPAHSPTRPDRPWCSTALFSWSLERRILKHRGLSFRATIRIARTQMRKMRVRVQQSEPRSTCASYVNTFLPRWRPRGQAHAAMIVPQKLNLFSFGTWIGDGRRTSHNSVVREGT
jgi:hypothetical protein